MFGFFEQGAVEFLLIAALGLIVLGPKELPIVMRRVGQFVAKMRGMAAEFRASFDELARQAELDELRKEVEALRQGDFTSNTSASPPPEPAYSYNPYDTAAAGLDNTGYAALPESAAPPPIMGEGVPPAAAEVTVKPARKPRAKKAAPDAEPVAEPAAKPARKPRAKKAGADTAGADAAE